MMKRSLVLSTLSFFLWTGASSASTGHSDLGSPIGVNKITAGTGMSVSPSNGLGSVTLTAVPSFTNAAGTSAGSLLSVTTGTTKVFEVSPSSVTVNPYVPLVVSSVSIPANSPGIFVGKFPMYGGASTTTCGTDLSAGYTMGFIDGTVQASATTPVNIVGATSVIPVGITAVNGGGIVSSVSLAPCAPNQVSISSFGVTNDGAVSAIAFRAIYMRK